MEFDILELKNHVIDFLTNRVLLCAIISWFLAQFIKLFTSPKHREKMSFTGFVVGSGGMPSSHSAVVCATCFSCGILYGFDTALFAISAVLAVVVMRDAAGVRRESGKQAAVINQMSRELSTRRKNFTEVTLSELLGHTPLQVLFGALLGLAMAFFCQCWLFRIIFPAF
ncbi:MAG: divergent PAP2 family protein [Ruminococcaceae bacterium]|nr:divergent PAP2 family protein [Oscillospiraceae bacterium]